MFSRYVGLFHRVIYVTRLDSQFLHHLILFWERERGLSIHP